MKTISAAVKAEIDNYPYLREVMSEKILNLSALAKKIQPAIEQTLLKPASHGSIVIALQRLQADIKPFPTSNPAMFLNDLSVTSGLEEVTLSNSREMHSELVATSNLPDWMGKVSVTSMGYQGINVVGPTKFAKKLRDRVPDDMILGVVENLSALSLRRVPGETARVGVLYYPLQVLAWNNVSAIEIVTTPSDIVIFIRDKDVSRAFTAIYDSLEFLSSSC